MHLSGPAAVVLDPALQVRNQTAWAADVLYRLNPPEEQMPPIPAAVYNVGPRSSPPRPACPSGSRRPESTSEVGAG